MTNTYEVFTEKYSKIIQAEGLASAIIKFYDREKDMIIGIHDVKFNSKLLPIEQEGKVNYDKVLDLLYGSRSGLKSEMSGWRADYKDERMIESNVEFQRQITNVISLIESPNTEQGKVAAIGFAEWLADTQRSLHHIKNNTDELFDLYLTSLTKDKEYIPN